MLADFEASAQGIPGLTVGKMFGAPSLMVGKKSVGTWIDPYAVFKLPAGPREAALALSGAKLYDPLGKGRPMKEWVMVPTAHKAEWPKFAKAAYKYLTGE